MSSLYIVVVLISFRSFLDGTSFHKRFRNLLYHPFLARAPAMPHPTPQHMANSLNSSNPCKRCLTSSGVFGSVCTGMLGHVVVKHRGCHDLPQLCMARTRHSRPTNSWLQTGHLTLVFRRRRGCMVVYVRVGRTLVLRRLLVVFLAASVVPSCIRLSRIRTVFASTPLPANTDPPFCLLPHALPSMVFC